MNLLTLLLVGVLAGSSSPATGANAPGPTSTCLEFLWYPNSSHFVFSHLELAVGEDVWGGKMVLRHQGRLETFERAARTGGRPFLRISLNVTSDEFGRIQTYLREHQNEFIYGTCSGTVCRAVALNSGIVLPPALRESPTATAAYLGLLRLVRYGRIDKLEWVGSSRPREYLKLSSLGFLGPLIEIKGLSSFGQLSWWGASEAVRSLLALIGP